MKPLKRKFRRILAAVCAAAAVGAAPALAQNWLGGPAGDSVGGMTVEEAGAVLKNEGLDVTFAEGAEAGVIYSEVDGLMFEIQTLNCKSTKRCTEFLFIAAFDLADGISLEKINEWNWAKPAGRASRDAKNDPFLDHIISVSSPADAGAFREGLILWFAALGEFADFIDLPVEPGSA